MDQFAPPHQIARILAAAPTQQDLFHRWADLAPMLEGSRLICAISGGFPQPLRPQHHPASGAYIRGIFADSPLTFLDDATWAALRRFTAAGIPIDHSASFDTNAASYLTSLIEERSNEGARRIRMLLEYLTTVGANYDFGLYILENHDEIVAHGLDKPALRANLRAIEILKDFDEERFLKTGEVRPNIDERTIQERMERTVEQERRLDKSDEGMAFLFRNRRLTYLMLLEICRIEFTYTRQSFRKKLLALLALFDEWSTLFLRELIVAVQLFDKGQGSQFFGRVQKGRTDILEVLRNLAWDLQLFPLFQTWVAANVGGARHYLPYLVTFDRALAELWDAYSLKALFIPAEGGMVPLGKTDVLRYVMARDPKSGAALRAFLTGDAVERRTKREVVDREPMLPGLIADAEDRLCRAAGMTRRERT